MKIYTSIIAAFLSALAIVRADDVAVTLPVPVTITETVTTQSTTTSPVIESILIDIEHSQVGVKLRGIESRVVVSGDAYKQVMAPNLSTLVSAVQAALTAALTPPEVISQ